MPLHLPDDDHRMDFGARGGGRRHLAQLFQTMEQQPLPPGSIGFRRFPFPAGILLRRRRFLPPVAMTGEGPFLRPSCSDLIFQNIPPVFSGGCREYYLPCLPKSY